jgi:Zn-dependent M28 family amino/carboxypeptidase
VGVTTDPESILQAGTLSFRWLDDFAGHTQTQNPESAFQGEAIFVGYGIKAPEYAWNDYAGANVRGKVVVLVTNEPPSQDDGFFEGRALTYYGRWTYKFEEAARQGAAAALIIHTDATAGYGWNVVRNSWGREDAQPKGRSGLPFTGWLTREAGSRLVSIAGHDVDRLIEQAGKPGFHPLPLNVPISGKISSKIRNFSANNVIGRIEGSDPAASNESVIFTAHWDHLGMTPRGDGDRIFNGAVDNATGCAMIAEIARAWSSLAVKPRRSALFFFTTGEEAGLLGSSHYVGNPVTPLDRTAMVLNFDSFHPVGMTRDVVLARAERSSNFSRIEDIARRFELTVLPDPRPESGGFFRSDHFPFARAGIVALSVRAGSQYYSLEEQNTETVRRYGAERYHQPSDEYDESWDFSGMVQMARFGFALGLDAANAGQRPQWIEEKPTGAAPGRGSGPAKRGTSRPRSPRPK